MSPEFVLGPVLELLMSDCVASCWVQLQGWWYRNAPPRVFPRPGHHAGLVLSQQGHFFFSLILITSGWRGLSLPLASHACLICFGVLAALPWGSSRSPAAFLTYPEIFYGFVPNLLSLENYQLALIHFLLSFTARRST